MCKPWKKNGFHNVELKGRHLRDYGHYKAFRRELQTVND